MNKMKKVKDNKDLSYYLNLPWTYTIEKETHEEVSYYIIRVNELPGICTDSESLDVGMQEIKELIACAIEIYKEKNEPIPEPIDKDRYKGKILYRTDSERHYYLAKIAQQQHKSLSKTLDMIVDAEMQKFKSRHVH